MSEVTDIVAPMLQRLQTQLGVMDRRLDVLTDDVKNLKVRVTNVEENMVATNRRLDTFELWLDRIERRLELTEA